MLCLVHTSVVQVVNITQKNQRGKDAESDPLFFGSFCTTLITQKTKSESGFSKECCLQDVPLRFTERKSACKKTSSKDKEAHIINVFQFSTQGKL